MSDDAALIEVLRRQEAELVFPGFDEHTAFAIGTAIAARAERDGLPIVCAIRFWNRPLFYAAMPGSNGDNQHWARRKSNAVERWGKSSYRALIENKRSRSFTANEDADPRTYALHGGAFPILVRGTSGAVGSITVSGLPEADDHRVVVEAVCGHLQADAARYSLP